MGKHWDRNSRLNKSLVLKGLNILGLAVLSMCGNLAASELRAIFMKIHYFGRKISWRRQQISKEKQRSVSNFGNYRIIDLDQIELSLLIEDISLKSSYRA